MATPFPIAIVGIGCRLPGNVVDPESFWQLLCSGRSGVREVPEDRWSNQRFFHPDPECLDSIITKWGGFIQDLDKFDARFWGVSPREAMRMDPQQRLLLEVAWEALEDGGTPPSKLRGQDVGVFVGISANDYGCLQVPYHEIVDAYTNSGNTASIASNRISYMLDLKGPSLSVDTACSSSLVAVWLACESMWSGRCSASLVGGVNALITPHASVGFSRASMLSRSGQCYAFDARANGYVRGEGVGVIYLKPLPQALADRDQIYAVIRAAAANQDGHTSSMTVPGVEGQSAMLRKAYQMANIDIRRIAYIEAHGTGTPVGDPIELTALGRVLGAGRKAEDRILIGSVKTNIGHLESGSGIAGLIKAALVLHHKTVPKSLNYEQPNPNIPFDTLSLRVAASTQPLPQPVGEGPVVGVNSFGFGGTNAHVVLESTPCAPACVSDENGDSDEHNFVLPISAKDDTALRSCAESFLQRLSDPSVRLAEFCTSAGNRKEHHERRLVVFGKDRTQLQRRIAAWLAGADQVKGVVAGRPSKSIKNLTFVYTGQGAQWWAMGQQLLEREPIFRDRLESIDRLLSPLSGWSLLDKICSDCEHSEIDRTDIAQPAIFALQVALTELWASWGIRPNQVIGHSVGEVAAAFCAGIYSLEDAVEIIYHRSRLQHTTGGKGRMLVVGISASEAEAAIGLDRDFVQVAVINNPNLVTLSGDRCPLEKIAERFQAENRFLRWLPIDYAFHTHQMEPIREELIDVLKNIQPRIAAVPFYSTVTSGALDGPELNGEYWWRNVREPVMFGPTIIEMLKNQACNFLEIGPHPALATSLRECNSATQRNGLVLHSLRRESDESDEVLSNLAYLHLDGFTIDWPAVNRSSNAPERLPKYAWNHESFWLETEQSRRARLAAPDHPLLGIRSAEALPTWTIELDLHRHPFLADHQLWDLVVFPGAGYAEIGLAVARTLFPNEKLVVENLAFHKALFVASKDPPLLQTTWSHESKTFSIYGRTRSKLDWELHATGQLLPMTTERSEKLDLDGVVSRLPEELSREEISEEFRRAGFQFGPNFQLLESARKKNGEVIGWIQATAAIYNSAGEFHLHPSILDACFQLSALTRTASPIASENFFLPKSIRRVQLWEPNGTRNIQPGTRLIAAGHMIVNEPNMVEIDLRLLTETGSPIADIRGFRSEWAPQTQSSTSLEECFYQTSWNPKRLKGTQTTGTCNFPDNPSLVAELQQSVATLNDDTGGLEYYQGFVPQINAVVPHILANAYLDLGWKPSLGNHFSTRELLAELHIVPKFERLLDSQLRQLVHAGWLRQVDDTKWEVIAAPTKSNILSSLDDLGEQYGYDAELQLIRRAASNLASVLCGDVDPVQLLFPGGSSELMSNFYTRANDLVRIHEQIRKLLQSAIGSLPQSRAIRVLEVGGGTASLTRTILSAFPAERTEYTFTDVGAGFLSSAKSVLSEFPFVDYHVLDIEKDVQPQGIAAHAFDLIVATNVLHATSDVAKSLTNLRRCMASDGMLLFVETMARMTYVENLVFGLLDGWWKFSDAELREKSPLLDRTQWLKLLTDCGFSQAVSLSPSITVSEATQVTFLARGPLVENMVESPRQDSSTYVVFVDQSGLAERLCNQLQARGSNIIRVFPGSSFVASSRNQFIINPADPQHYVDLFAAIHSQVQSVSGAIHAWSLDTPGAEELTTDQLSRSQAQGVLSVLALVKCEQRPSNVWVLVDSVFAISAEDQCSGVAASPLVGFLRVANNEFYPRRAYLIDVGTGRTSDNADALLSELTTDHQDLEVAYRGGQRFTNQLGYVRLDELPGRRTPVRKSISSYPAFRLESRGEGILTNLQWRETARRQLGPDEIEVQVHAGGINFRDVMKALGTYPGNPIDVRWYGDDFAGTVVAVGSNVTQAKIGDRVAGMAPYAFQSYAVVDARLVFRLPDSMTFEQAATLPTVFLTAHYAIHHLARMVAGESILIHGGTGGVGQAAIQIAQQLGLKIFATAGSDEKRQLLREQGVEHVFNSRTLEFADQIKDVTKGYGVDAVLNSLAGDFIPKSFELLAPYGRFLEIGKMDIYNNSKIGLRQFKDNISYFVIDLGQHLACRQTHAGKLFAEIAEQIRMGHYRPLPYTSFPISQCVEAFRRMAQGKHIGKNVLIFDDPNLMIGPNSDPHSEFRSNGTYLITGGAGGFGWELAKQMAEHGARHLVLMSRSGPRDTERQEIEQLRAAGINIVDARGDVTVADEVDQIVQTISQSMPPLVGVVHGAMVLDDDFISELTPERFRSALDVKILGGWNLHLATRRMPLEDFVCFSSYSSVFGAPKQANYNAGNYFLDGLSHHRRSLGLPALTIDWGALRGAGFVERNQKTADYLDKIGLDSFNMQEATESFRRARFLDCAQISAARIDWTKLPSIAPVINESSTFTGIMHSSRSNENGGSLAVRLRAAPADQRSGLMQSFIASQIAGVFGISESQVERDTPLTQMGLDSLMALELKNRVEKEAGIALPMNEILNGPSLNQLSAVVLKHIDRSASSVEPVLDEIKPAEPTVVAESAELLERIDDLPEEEIDRLLAEMESSRAS